MRHNDCFTCHNSSNAMNVPGMLVRSQFTAPNGTTMPWLGNYVSDHRSPLSERWGGWYVTGKTGAIRHMGNAVVTNGSNPESPVIDQTLHLASLAGRFDTNAYLSEYSDIVALMVFENQMRSEEHTSELQSHSDLVCRLLLEKKKKKEKYY